ncbi:hypothetical protein Acr_02g0013850 [Actinidia rufa]|uniref:X8 domain-containing protein n=1 Tax=Actinidia rufa TaxID=165716 RepID=A0A7J0E9T5_9ERIC|nr:hypothetical protein Acr_02g0013850 [Actinidia rufa]
MWRGEGGRGARGGRRFQSEEEDRAGGRRGGCDRRAVEGAAKGSGPVGEYREERGVAEERAACGGVLALSRWEREDGSNFILCGKVYDGILLCGLDLLGILISSSQELVEQRTLHDPYPVILQSLSHTGVSAAISVGNEHLQEVSNSVNLAKNWVRTHVLSHYPATKITTIVVGSTVFCNRNQEHQIEALFPLLVGAASLPLFSLSSSLKSPLSGFDWPLCNPSAGGATPNLPFWGYGVCPSPVCLQRSCSLQEAMDYACCEGGADCEVIRPQGNCYSPDIFVAHASYAFNSYWQKNKRVGGTCSFGGTAIFINAEPSKQSLFPSYSYFG